MKELDLPEMESITGGDRANGWCFASGILWAFAFGCGPIGLAMWGPPALATGIICAHN